jgi:hypothetical protein
MRTTNDTILRRKIVDLKLAKADRDARRFFGTNGHYAEAARKAFNKADRKAARAFCRIEVGNNRPGSIRMGPFLAREDMDLARLEDTI